MQKSASFSRCSLGIVISVRHTRMSGMMPMLRSMPTECCEGFVFSSPADLRYGTSVRCTKQVLSKPFSKRNWRAASRNGSDSMSPETPPISQRTMSTSCSPAERIAALISFVMWGTTCTVPPR